MTTIRRPAAIPLALAAALALPALAVLATAQDASVGRCGKGGRRNNSLRRLTEERRKTVESVVRRRATRREMLNFSRLKFLCLGLAEPAEVARSFFTW